VKKSKSGLKKKRLSKRKENDFFFHEKGMGKNTTEPIKITITARKESCTSRYEINTHMVSVSVHMV
jgi:hypothetical protein